MKIELEKILFDIKYYRKEIELKKLLIREIKTEFNNKIINLIKSDSYLHEIFLLKIENIQTNTKVLKNVEFSEEIKPLFKEIVKLSHPDKVGLDKIQIFNKAVQAKENGNLVELIECVYELGIEYTPTKIELKYIKDFLIKLKKESSSIENIYLYKYYEIEDDSLKNDYLIDWIKTELSL